MELKSRRDSNAAEINSTQVAVLNPCGEYHVQQQIEVVYENGVLRPLGPLPAQLHEHQHLTVTINAVEDLDARLDRECIAAARCNADPNVSLAEVRQILAKVPGSLSAHISAEREEG
jgi:predicted DNA-binding antitoxin AbrB/MazE fold protein